MFNSKEKLQKLSEEARKEDREDIINYRRNAARIAELTTDLRLVELQLEESREETKAIRDRMERLEQTMQDHLNNCPSHMESKSLPRIDPK